MTEPKPMELFHEAVNKYFPGTIEMKEYMRRTFECLNSHGFEDENTMGMISICRDEITDPIQHEVVKYWGLTFDCCNLAGFVMMGKTGLAAATAHVPLFNGLKRFAFYSMPHIAISQEGEIGKVYREGLNQASSACGALALIVKELNAGQLKLEMDMDDIEQSIIRQKILSAIKYGDKPDLVEITKLASQVITQDVEKLLGQLDHNEYKFAVMTGIQIHGPNDTHWIWPQQFYLAGLEFPEQRLYLTVF